MFDKRKFRAVAVLNDKSMADIADMLGINRVTLYRKLNGDSDFLRWEIEACCSFLNISNPTEIFFAE